MREVVRLVMDGKEPPYVPWSFGFTQEAQEKLQAHFGSTDLEPVLKNHFLTLGNDIGFFDPLGENLVRDVFGVTWDRSIDRDIGVVRGCVLPKPTLDGYHFPDPLDPRFFADIPGRIGLYGDRFRIYSIGFSFWERAWTLRGMQNLLMDFYDNPGFVRDLFRSIADYNIAQIQGTLPYEIDAVYFGDDWGQQRGLQMGPVLWRKFLYPELKRQFAAVLSAGKYVMLHSCGDVDELFEDLVGIGLRCFNPFQPEVMDIEVLMKQYRGKLAFYGGLSTQRTLPYGTVADVDRESQHLLEMGRAGGYIFAPAHDVEGDVSLENMLAFIEAAQKQPGYLNP